MKHQHTATALTALLGVRMCQHCERASPCRLLAPRSTARVIGVFLFLVAPPLMSQSPRFSVEVGVSYQSGWTWLGNALDGMRQAGLDGGACGNAGEIFCSGGGHPWVNNPDPIGLAVTAEYRLGPRVALRGLFSSAGETLAEGYYDGGMDAYLTDAELDIVIQKVRIYGLLASYRPTSLMRLSGGPVLGTTKVRTATSGGQLSEMRSRRYIGALVEVALTVPAQSTVYLHAAGQYRWTAARGLGPLEARNGSGEVLTTMPRIGAPLSHTAIVLGLGIRIR